MGFLPDQNVEYETVISSFGGVGTTLLYGFLDDYEVGFPDPDERNGYWKHLQSPPPDQNVKPGFRALYVFGNPMNAILSVFRRGYQQWHEQNMTGRRNDTTLGKETDLKTFLERGEDVFEMEDHFRNWVEADRAYPIMLIKYDALWERRAEWGAFLGVPTAALDDFPERRPRKSRYADQPASTQKGLQELYADLQAEVEARPDVQII